MIPRELRPRVLELAQEGHHGIVKQNVDCEVKYGGPRLMLMQRSCPGISDYAPPQPMARAFPPSDPWEDCASDILGPLPSGESLLVAVDYFIRYSEVVILRSTSIAQRSLKVKTIVPHTLKTDNGPQLVSGEFETFLTENGIEHRTTLSLWPQAYGEVERQNCTLMKSVQIAHIEGKNWRREFLTFLTAYRSIPEMTTGATPWTYMQLRNSCYSSRKFFSTSHMFISTTFTRYYSSSTL